MSLLVYLPPNVAKSILLNFCDVKDLVKFDSANCRSEHRKLYLEIIQRPDFVLVKGLNNDGIIWACNRNLLCEEFNFSGDGLLTYLQLGNFSTSKIDNLSFSNIEQNELSFETLINVINSSDELKSLKVENIDWLDDSVFEHISEHILHQLTHVIIYECPSLSTNILSIIASKCHNLVMFYYRNFENLSDEKGVLELISNNPNLRYFQLNQYCHLDDAYRQANDGRMPLTFDLSEATLEAIVLNCPNITDIIISMQEFPSADSMVAVIKCCPHLRTLNILAGYECYMQSMLQYVHHGDSYKLFAIREVNNVLLRAVIKCAAYQELFFSTVAHQLTCEVLDIIAENMQDTLETLYMHHPYSTFGFSPPALVKLLRNCSKLDKLVLKNISLYRHFESLLNLHNVTKLELSCRLLSAETVLDIVTSNPSLLSVEWQPIWEEKEQVINYEMMFLIQDILSQRRALAGVV